MSIHVYDNVVHTKGKTTTWVMLTTSDKNRSI